MNDSDILAVFTEGASISSIAALIEDTPELVEKALRGSSRNWRDVVQYATEESLLEYIIGRLRSMQPGPSACKEIGFALECCENAAGWLQRRNLRSSMEEATGEFTDYPEALRGPSADHMRLVFDLLRPGPATVSELEIRLGTSAGEFYGEVAKWLCDGLYALRAKGWQFAQTSTAGSGGWPDEFHAGGAGGTAQLWRVAANGAGPVRFRVAST